MLTYHRAGPVGPLDLIDGNTLSASAAAFERQVEFCRRHVTIVGMDDVLSFVRGGTLPHFPLLITLDDGYLDNFTVAYPILKRHGARATFFVATSYIDERRLFWWDRVHFILASSTRARAELAYPRPMTLDLTPRGKPGAIAQALRVVKDHFALDLPRFLEHLAERAGVELDGERERKLVLDNVMTWDHVRELRRGGMDVQSHTHTHRVLHTLPHDALVADLSMARSKLEDTLGERVRAVAYPVGKAPSYSPDTRRAVREAGYEIGFSNRRGVNRLRDFDPLDAKRIPVDQTFNDAYFSSVLALPGLAYPPRPF